MFSKLTLDEGVVGYEYSKTFKLLSEAVKLTNSSKVKETEKKTEKIFKPIKKTDDTPQSVSLDAQRPIWLPGLDSNQRP